MAELIWDGKYDEHGNKRAPVRIELPFQTVETVNESVQERQRTLELSSSGNDPEWRNRLIWGDKKYVLPSLLPEFAGKVDLIYIDPPFDTGADFSFSAQVPAFEENGDTEGEEVSFLKEPSILEQKAYRDTWGRGLASYLDWFSETTVLLRELLAESGSMFVHLDWHVGHYAKAVLDEILGIQNFRNEIVWKRQSAHSDSHQCGAIHDTIFFYSRSETWVWNDILCEPGPDYIDSFFDQVETETGRRYARGDLTGAGVTKSGLSGKPWRGINPSTWGRHWAVNPEELDRLDKEGRLHWPKKGMPRLKRYLNEFSGVPLQDIWTDIRIIHNQSPERVGYPTQKPEALLDRIIRACSKEGNLVLDCFAGSGTTAAVAEKLNRRWIACDLGRFAIHTTRKRLLGIPGGVKPFIVQNLGKYERQQWQVAEFPANGKNRLEEQKERETAYRKFILELYHATPVSGHVWLHGVKGGRMVHVAAVDAPVTRADVNAIAAEVWRAAGKGPNSPQKPAVDVLGWEFALEINETAKEIAAQARVDAAFKKIPREVLEKKAVDQGDVYFFELGALRVDAKTKKRELTLTLSDFVIPLDDVPAEVRSAIKHWSQMVDYWAVDWDFKDDTFHNQWQSYRTRKDPKLDLSVKHEYLEPGKYTLVVKVIDILGNDTTKTLSIEIK
ncbi:MAG TPA: DNA methyltransferase [Terriglobales bacterium]|nr:DNA methyltransferase [Terriglobales bacterium]